MFGTRLAAAPVLTSLDPIAEATFRAGVATR